MDAKTIEAMSALGVDITPDTPTPVPTPEEAAKAVEDLKNKDPEVVVKDWVEIKEEPKEEPKDPEPNPGEEPKIWNDDGEAPESKPKDEEPKISNDLNPDLKTEPKEIPKEEPKSEEDLDEILKALEDLTEESLESKKDEPPTKTEEEIKEKIEEAKKQEGNPEKQSKTIQEIVDLNVKLQNELAVVNTASKARKNKLTEVQEELSAIKMDDSRVVVPEELKSVNNYLKKFRETSNETFKIKAIQEAVDLIENLTGKPLKWNYIDDFIEDNLKGIETISKKQVDEIARDGGVDDMDPAMKFAMTHWVSV